VVRQGRRRRNVDRLNGVWLWLASRWFAGLLTRMNGGVNPSRGGPARNVADNPLRKHHSSSCFCWV